MSWEAVLGSLAAAPVAGLVGWVTSRRVTMATIAKTEAETAKTDADADKTKADAAQTLTGIALGLVEPLRKRLATVERKLGEHLALLPAHTDWDKWAYGELESRGDVQMRPIPPLTRERDS